MLRIVLGLVLKFQYKPTQYAADTVYLQGLGLRPRAMLRIVWGFLM